MEECLKKPNATGRLTHRMIKNSLLHTNNEAGFGGARQHVARQLLNTTVKKVKSTLPISTVS